MILKNVIKLCGERGISISKLEKTLGFGNATIRGWENSSPTIDKLKKVADYFGVSVETLIADDSDESPAGASA